MPEDGIPGALESHWEVNHNGSKTRAGAETVTDRRWKPSARTALPLQPPPQPSPAQASPRTQPPPRPQAPQTACSSASPSRTASSISLAPPSLPPQPRPPAAPPQPAPTTKACLHTATSPERKQPPPSAPPRKQPSSSAVRRTSNSLLTSASPRTKPPPQKPRHPNSLPPQPRPAQLALLASHPHEASHRLKRHLPPHKAHPPSHPLPHTPTITAFTPQQHSSYTQSRTASLLQPRPATASLLQPSPRTKGLTPSLKHPHSLNLSSRSPPHSQSLSASPRTPIFRPSPVAQPFSLRTIARTASLLRPAAPHSSSQPRPGTDILLNLVAAQAYLPPSPRPAQPHLQPRPAAAPPSAIAPHSPSSGLALTKPLRYSHASQPPNSPSRRRHSTPILNHSHSKARTELPLRAALAPARLNLRKASDPHSASVTQTYAQNTQTSTSLKPRSQKLYTRASRPHSLLLGTRHRTKKRKKKDSYSRRSPPETQRTRASKKLLQH
nr:uncharacterized protein DKFZp434B061-like [Penaeus vannamei]